MSTSRWLSETGGTAGAAYDERFRRLAATGADVHGEAALVASLLPTAGTRVLDAGCGTGRVAIELARRGADVTGVDSDASMLAVARGAAPGLRWLLADLGSVALEGGFDGIVLAGNVEVFLTPGSEPAVLAHLAAALTPTGLLVSGWQTDRLSPAQHDTWCAAAGLVPVERWAGWAREPWHDDASWCVSVQRRG